MRPGETVRAFLDALSAKEVEQAMTFCSPDLVLEMPALDPPVTRGAERIGADLALVIEPAVVVDWRIVLQVEEGELVMNERLDRLVYPDGSAMAVPIAGIWRVRDGRIEHWRDLFDSRSMDTQLGADWRSFSKRLKRWRAEGPAAPSP